MSIYEGEPVPGKSSRFSSFSCSFWTSFSESSGVTSVVSSLGVSGSCSSSGSVGVLSGNTSSLSVSFKRCSWISIEALYSVWILVFTAVLSFGLTSELASLVTSLSASTDSSVNSSKSSS